MNVSRQFSTPRNVMDAHRSIVYYCKNGSFPDAERMFQKMCEMIKFQPTATFFCSSTNDSDYEKEQHHDNYQQSLKKNYSRIQIDRFQKSISTMVRYAPKIQDSLDYACFCLYQVPEPLRDESLEKTMTVNLIYLYGRKGGHENFSNALELIKTGVTLGYGLPLESSTSFTNNSDEVFFGVSRPVLRYFGMELSPDRKYII